MSIFSILTYSPDGSHRASGHGFNDIAERSHGVAAEISDRVRETAEARGLRESEVFERIKSEVVKEDVDWGLNA